MKPIQTSGVTLHRRNLCSIELRKVEELDLSAYPVLAICRDMLTTQCRSGLKFAKMVNKAKRLEESARGIYAAFLSMKKNAYVDGITKLLDMAGVNGSTARFTRGGSEAADCSVVVSVTPDIGYYTSLAKRSSHDTSSLIKMAKSMEKVLIATGTTDVECDISIRNYLTSEECDLIENLDLTGHEELYPVWDIFRASCETLNTVNRMVTRSISTFSEPSFKVYADNEVYLRDLCKLLEVAGIKTKTIINHHDADGGTSKTMDILIVTPYLGRNTFIHDELEPTIWK